PRRALPSFPTRRSSDLPDQVGQVLEHAPLLVLAALARLVAAMLRGRVDADHDATAHRAVRRAVGTDGCERPAGAAVGADGAPLERLPVAVQRTLHRPQQGGALLRVEHFGEARAGAAIERMALARGAIGPGQAHRAVDAEYARV